MLKSQLESRNRYLEHEVAELNSRITIKNELIKILSAQQQQVSAIVIAAERVSDAMAHIVGNYTDLKKSRLLDK